MSTESDNVQRALTLQYGTSVSTEVADSLASKANLEGGNSFTGAQTFGTTHPFYLLSDWGGFGGLNAGTLFGTYGSSGGDLSFFASINSGTAGAGVAMAYSVNAGASVLPAVRVENVPSGFGTLVMMKDGGNTLVGTDVDAGTGVLQVNGTLAATSFYGDGSTLTGLVSSQITDATSLATPDKIVIRGSEGEAKFAGDTKNAIEAAASGNHIGVKATSATGSAIYGWSVQTYGVYARSTNGTALYATADSGNIFVGNGVDGDVAIIDNHGSATFLTITSTSVDGGLVASGEFGIITANGDSGQIYTSGPNGSIYTQNGGNIISSGVFTQTGTGDNVFAGSLSASNLSGTNTGDQTDISGNAATATAANGLKTATTTVSVSSATAPTSGQVLTATSSTAATWQAISVAVGSITGLGTGVATWLATPSGANLASALTTALPASKGGTGLTALGTGVATALGVNVGSAGAFVTFNGAGGTPSSINLANGTALPVSGIAASTTTALGVGSIELGHASDTTLSRSSAGRLAVEGVNVVTVSSTDTLTNKTLTSPAISGITQLTYSDNTFANGLMVKNTSTGTNSLTGITIQESGGTNVGYMQYCPSNFVNAGLQNTVIFGSIGAQKVGFVANAGASVGQDVYFKVHSTATASIFITGSSGGVSIGTATDAGASNLLVAGTAKANGGFIYGTYTVGTFPTTTYLEAVVTDALAPVVGETVVAGGSAKCKVMYNGSAKIVTAVL